MRKVLGSLLMMMLFVTVASAGVETVQRDDTAAFVKSMVEFKSVGSFEEWVNDGTNDLQLSIDAGNPNSLKKFGGASCGSNTCGWFQYCCNASCGICVPYGWSCTQQACGGDS